MSSTIQCPHCKYSKAVKDDRSNAVFCAACGSFDDPFYSWKKTDIRSITIPSLTSLWIPLVIGARLKDSPARSWVAPEHQVVDPEYKWGRTVHGYIARHVCDVDRGWILHKKIYDAIITGQTEDLICASVEVGLEKDLGLLIDINDVKLGLPRAKEKFDGVITRTSFLGKTAAAIYIFNPKNTTVKRHFAKPPVTPKQAVEDKPFMDSLTTAW
jgi:hypothetical protein